MRDPLAWAAWMVWLGVLAWPAWRPTLAPLLAGAWFMGALALVGRRWPASRLALLVGAWLVGGALCAVRPTPPRLGARVPVTGQVRSVVGGDALVQSDHGRLALRFHGRPPPAGTWIAAVTTPIRRRASLPGEPDRARVHQRARARGREVQRWIRLGLAPPAPPDFSLAHNPGLLIALATGDRSQVPEATLELLRHTGTRHLLSISGLHIGLIAGLAWAVARRLTLPMRLLRSSLPASALPAVIGLIAALSYAHLVGWPVSARRATWMVGASAAASLLGRRPRPWSLLGLAALAVLADSPAQASSAGFLLSFGAVAGILLIAPLLTRRLPPDLPRPLSWAARSFAATAGALLGTLPASAWLFQELPLSAPVANLFAVPLLGGVAVPSALIAARLHGPLQVVVLAIADAAASAALWWLHLLDLPVLHPAVGPLGAALLALALVLRRRPVLSAGLALLLLCAPGPRSRELVTSYLSVGQGDAALLAFPDGRRWLVDGGPPGERLVRWLRREGVSRLDAVFLSHCHPDHMGGLIPVLGQLPVGELWIPRDPLPDEAGFGEFLSLARARDVPLRRPGDPLPAVGAGTRARVLHPTAGWTPLGPNEDSLVLWVGYGQRSLLFTGDIERHAEADLIPTLGPVDVVKVPHHGSASSSTEAFVAATRPQLAVISAGPHNRFRHPRPITLYRWRDSRVFRTDRDGTIEVRTDGDHLRAWHWRRVSGWEPVDARRPLQYTEAETSP